MSKRRRDTKSESKLSARKRRKIAGKTKIPVHSDEILVEPEDAGHYKVGRGLLSVPLIYLILLAEVLFSTIDFTTDPDTGCMHPAPLQPNCPYTLQKTIRGYYYILLSFCSGAKYVYLHQLWYVWTSARLPDPDAQLMHLCSNHCSNHVILGGMLLLSIFPIFYDKSIFTIYLPLHHKTID